MSSTKTVAFLGASGGTGLTALKHTLAAGHTCITLCRVPSKLEAVFPADKTPNLTIIQGNALDEACVSQLLTRPGAPTQLVDTIVFTVGGVLNTKNMTLDDPDVCKNSIAAMLSALSKLRASGATGTPRLIVVSTTGISKHARDVPLAMIPMYKFMLKQPHADKEVMEERLIASSEDYVIVRPSFMMFNQGETGKKIRVGVEDPKNGVETKAVGYAISKEDTGKWMAESLIMGPDAGKYSKKIVTITY